MKKIIVTVLFLISFYSYSQVRIKFTYDEFGNQTKRYFEFGGAGKTTSTNETPNIVYNKLYDDDELSFYPNPVNEELYIKWLFKQSNKVVEKITVYDINGKSCYSTTKIEGNQNMISFQNMTTGIYFVYLTCSDASTELIKIVKK